MANKHPWEYKQEIIKDKASKEEFQKLINKIKDKEEKHKSDMFIKKGTKSKSKATQYHFIDGIPHKMVAGSWVPLTKISKQK